MVYTNTAEDAIKSAYKSSLQYVSSPSFVKSAMTASRDTRSAKTSHSVTSHFMISKTSDSITTVTATVYVSQTSTNNFPLLTVVGRACCIKLIRY